MISAAEIVRLDAEDPLRDRRNAFQLPAGVIYLDGNSLGPPTKAALVRLARTAEREWGEGLIRSWNDADWINLPKTCGAKIARIIGAAPEDVIVCDSVSVNIFKLAAALKRALPEAQIAVAKDEFPTDVYILDSLAGMFGERIDSSGEEPQAQVILVKSAVDFRTGAIADLEATEAGVGGYGGAVIWDLSHAAGVLDLRLQNRGVRFAVGCGYKFLNGGPGAPAFVYAAADAAGRLRQPLSGWMGHARPFDFAPDYEPAAGAARFAAGTPPILSMAALHSALDVFSGVEMRDIESKARRLSDIFLEGAQASGLVSVSPPAAARGGQISLRCADGYCVMQALIARGVIGDFRPPDIMRFGFSPLFLSYGDVFAAGRILGDVVKSGAWRNPRYAESRVVP